MNDRYNFREIQERLAALEPDAFARKLSSLWWNGFFWGFTTMLVTAFAVYEVLRVMR